ncbi:SDR family NAD(P)-dependent oxidoreductase [Parvularcula dongshanensis]|uniref:NADP-dependent 3-hydroxy acid dehydrogenase YdfG n=1 Tax=Parvularcula dongshanensis TaxID=1173995 RepID=A0A840I096_9PROT|nr:SDR family NAD(P)-dependent oxidoreductase [Parvularcula dongshanensis]MBB4658249.1 NADP-dependent 3-hydroxy acid dehydrogenase YdfG [Parvularcula dongshanensis]
MTDKSFEGRCALVTGATSGIGRATAERLLAGGAKVVAAGRRTDRLEGLAAGHEGRVYPLTLDVTDAKAVATLPAALPKGFAPDILVNNAGLALGLGGADEADLDQWDRMIDTNIRGLVHVTRAFLPQLKALPRADVVNIGSIAGTYPYPGGNVYGGTKAFVRQFSLNLRADLLGSKVRVACVEPGMADTEFSSVRFSGDERKAAKVYEGVEALTGEDIAEVIANLLALPPHVVVNRVEVMPVQQASGPLSVSRGEG